MKNSSTLISMIAIIFSLAIIQTSCKSKKPPVNTLPKKPTLVLDLKLKMPMGSGKNGAAVAFDPRLGYYYAVFAGNSSYPLSIFNASGQPVDTFSTAGFDARGLWYNPESGDVEGNGYGDVGVVILIRDEDGRPEDADWAGYLFSPPDDNSAVCFDTSKKEFVYYVGGILFCYGYESGERESYIS